MKKLIIITVLLLVAFSSKGQRFGNFEAIRLINGTAFSAGVRDGTIYYDRTDNKFKFRQGGIWTELGTGGGGTGITDGDKGDITVTGTGASWFIDNLAVTLPKIQSINTSTILGRAAIGTGVIEQLTGTQINTLLPTFTNTLKGLVPLSGSDTTNFLRSDGTWADPASGAGGGTTETASNLLTKSGSDIKMGGTQTVNTVLNLSSDADLEWSVKDPFSYGIVRDVSYGFAQGIHYVAGDYINKTGTYSRLTPQPHSIEMYGENSLGENVTFRVGAGNAGSSLMTLYTDNKTTKTGIVYASPGYVTQPYSLTTRQWVEDLVADVTVGGVADGDKGDITASNGGLIWTIDNGSVTLPKIQSINTARFLGRASASTGVVEQLTGTTATALLSTFSTGAKGLTPVSPGGTTQYLRADGTWQVPPTGGSTPGVFTSTVNGLAPASGGGTSKYLRSDATWYTPITTATNQIAYNVGATANTLSGSPELTYDNTTMTIGTHTDINLSMSILDLKGGSSTTNRTLKLASAIQTTLVSGTNNHALIQAINEPLIINTGGSANNHVYIIIPSGGAQLIFRGIPTTNPCASAPVGTVWRNGTVLNICP